MSDGVFPWANIMPEISGFWNSSINAAFSNIVDSMSLPLPSTKEGQTVVLIPGLGTNSSSMNTLSKKLKAGGFAPKGWGAGINTGYNAWDENRLLQIIEQEYLLKNKPVVLIGWSLGGFYARAVAHRVPEKISGVITLGTPLKISDNFFSQSCLAFAGINTDLYLSQYAQQALAKAAQPLSIPVLDIFSNRDGVSGHSASEVETYEANCSHFGLVEDKMVGDKILDWLKPNNQKA